MQPQNRKDDTPSTPSNPRSHAQYTSRCEPCCCRRRRLKRSTMRAWWRAQHSRRRKSSSGCGCPSRLLALTSPPPAATSARSTADVGRGALGTSCAPRATTRPRWVSRSSSRRICPTTRRRWRAGAASRFAQCWCPRASSSPTRRATRRSRGGTRRSLRG